MALDIRYFLAFTFEKYFVDKDTGLPLSNGYIKFFRDSARSTTKDVYILSGSPPNYTYTNIGSTVNLTGYGVPVYSNNNVALYLLPFELDDEGNITNTIDLYYYEVYSEDDVLQFTREGQPNVTAESTTETVNNNYVPNGQFWWHNDVPASESNDYVEGKITQLITTVAPGGWSFERTTGTNVVDIVTFERIDSVTSTNPTDNPRYRIRINCQDAGVGGSYKDLRLKFDSVNKFTGTTDYSYTFSIENNEDETLDNAQLVLIKNYGTGGSPETEIVIGTFDITPTATQISFTFPFNDNTGKTLSSTANDDYLQLSIRLPGDEEFDIAATDTGLFQGDFSDTNNIFTGTFVPTTDNQFTYQALAGSIVVNDYFETNNTDPSNPLEVKNPNLFLTPVLKETGLDFDRTIIGRVESYSNYNASDWDADSVHVSTNLIIPIGQQFATADYSPLNIPYSRLQAEYWISTLNLPRYGTGPNYMTVTIPASDNIMLVSNNSEGAVTNAADGTPPLNTGFTITTIHKETALYYSTAYMSPTAATFIMEGKFVGTPTTQPTDVDSGFIFTPLQFGTTLLKNITSALAPAGSTLTHTGSTGKYFIFDTVDSVPADHKWYVWFFVTNETDPAPATRTGIKITITGTETAQIIAQKVQQALNGWQETLITTVAAASIPAGAYFTISSVIPGPSSQLYAVWYEVNSMGTQPIVANAIFIKVTLTGSETTAQVATKTQIAMNMKNFSMPDYRGKFFRVWDNGAGVDPDAASRYSLVPGVIGDVVGTSQLSGNLSHTHGTDATAVVPGADLQGGPNAVSEAAAIDYDGGYESRPINEYVNVAIRY